MDNEVKRYDVEVRGCMGYERADELVEAERGEYVRSEDYDRLARELAECRAENDRLRASLANSGGPCSYCSLPKEEWSKCPHGLPGCPRADDAMLCPHVGDGLETERELAAWKRAADECNFVDSSTASRWLYERVAELMQENGDE